MTRPVRFECGDNTCKYNDPKMGYSCRFKEWYGKSLPGNDGCGSHQGYEKVGNVYRKLTPRECIQLAIDFYEKRVQQYSKESVEVRLTEVEEALKRLSKEQADLCELKASFVILEQLCGNLLEIDEKK